MVAGISKCLAELAVLLSIYLPPNSLLISFDKLTHPDCDRPPVILYGDFHGPRDPLREKEQCKALEQTFQIRQWWHPPLLFLAEDVEEVHSLIKGIEDDVILAALCERVRCCPYCAPIVAKNIEIRDVSKHAIDMFRARDCPLNSGFNACNIPYIKHDYYKVTYNDLFDEFSCLRNRVLGFASVIKDPIVREIFDELISRADTQCSLLKEMFLEKGVPFDEPMINLALDMFLEKLHEESTVPEHHAIVEELRDDCDEYLDSYLDLYLDESDAFCGACLKKMSSIMPKDVTFFDRERLVIQKKLLLTFGPLMELNALYLTLTEREVDNKKLEKIAIFAGEGHTNRLKRMLLDIGYTLEEHFGESDRTRIIPLPPEYLAHLNPES